MKVLSDRERHAYESPPCPICGGPSRTNFVSVLTVDQDPDDPDTPQWVAGTWECDRYLSSRFMTDCPECGERFDYFHQLSICPHVEYRPEEDVT